MEYRAMMLEKKLSASTINVRLSAVRKLIWEARRKKYALDGDTKRRRAALLRCARLS
jgi:hypothetical protein